MGTPLAVLVELFIACNTKAFLQEVKKDAATGQVSQILTVWYHLASTYDFASLGASKKSELSGTYFKAGYWKECRRFYRAASQGNLLARLTYIKVDYDFLGHGRLCTRVCRVCKYLPWASLLPLALWILVVDCLASASSFAMKHFHGYQHPCMNSCR